MIRLTLMALAGSVVLIVAGLLGQVGQLDEATAAIIQLLLIPVRLVGVFTAVAHAAAEGLFDAPQPTTTQNSGGGVPWGLLVSVVAVAVLGRVAGPRLYHLHRQRVARRRKLADAKTLIADHLLDLADDIDATEPEDRVAARQVTRAVDQYQRASVALDRPVRRLEDLGPALAALRRGQAAMASARASMDGGS